MCYTEVITLSGTYKVDGNAIENYRRILTTKKMKSSFIIFREIEPHLPEYVVAKGDIYLLLDKIVGLREVLN